MVATQAYDTLMTPRLVRQAESQAWHGPDETGVGDSTFDLSQALISSRRNVSARHLIEPGPTPQQLDALLRLAAAAPDHGCLTPWRFILVSQAHRCRLAEVFALALVDRDAGATLEQIESARDKAYRAPLLLLAIARLAPCEPNTPVLERMVSMGAAIQNMLLGAHAMGLGAGLTSGQAMASPRLAELLGLDGGEVPVCCINMGTPARSKPGRLRPVPDAFFSVL